MIDNDILRKYWVDNEQKFKDITKSVPYQARGIWYTEAFLFCSICDILGVEAIIESGMAYGCSTEIFANYFDFNILVIDNDQYSIFDETSNRLKKYNNLHIFKGDSYKLVPDGAELNKDIKLGIFIDGPKGEGARKLRDDLLKFDNISCFGYHDYSGQNKHNIGLFENSFITHELKFIDEFRYLDKKVIDTVPSQSQYKNGPGVCVEVRL